MVCHSLLQWITFWQISPPWPVRLGWPHTAWLSFVELDKAVIHVIRLSSFLWLWFQSICPLLPSLITYHLIWVFSYIGHGVSPNCHLSWPWMWGISSQLLLLTLDMGYLLSATAPDIGHGVSPLGHSYAAQQKRDQELTVAQIMNSLLPNSDLNWKKWGKPLDHSIIT